MRLICNAVLLAGLCLAGIVPALAQTVEARVTAEAFRTINVRSGPGVGYDVIGYLAEGNVVEVLGRSDAENNWLLIRYEGGEGWVAFFTVSVEGDLNALEIVAAAPSADSTPQVVENLQASSLARGDLLATAYRRVNVRRGPGTVFPVIGVLQPGDVVSVIGTNGADSSWLEIEFEGQSGWVAYFVVTVTGDLAAVTSGASANQFSVSSAVVLITRFNTNLRVEPSLDSEILSVIPFETVLEAEARTGDGGWLRVVYEGEVGWVITSLVNLGASDIETLPVVDG